MGNVKCIFVDSSQCVEVLIVWCIVYMYSWFHLSNAEKRESKILCRLHYGCLYFNFQTFNSQFVHTNFCSFFLVWYFTIVCVVVVLKYIYRKCCFFALLWHIFDGIRLFSRPKCTKLNIEHSQFAITSHCF